MKHLAMLLVILCGGCRSADSRQVNPPHPPRASTGAVPNASLDSKAETSKAALSLPAPERQRSANEAAGAALSAESVLSELEGRALLAHLFRQAGFRILYDVAVPGASGLLRLDGFDPVRQVGYEYVAVGERERVMSKAGTTDKILLIGPTSDDELLKKARIFLERHQSTKSQ